MNWNLPFSEFLLVFSWEKWYHTCETPENIPKIFLNILLFCDEWSCEKLSKELFEGRKTMKTDIHENDKSFFNSLATLEFLGFWFLGGRCHPKGPCWLGSGVRGEGSSSLGLPNKYVEIDLQKLIKNIIFNVIIFNLLRNFCEFFYRKRWKIEDFTKFSKGFVQFSSLWSKFQRF